MTQSQKARNRFIMTPPASASVRGPALGHVMSAIILLQHYSNLSPGRMKTYALLQQFEERLSHFSLAPATVSGGENSKGMLRLSTPAPRGGVTLALSSSDATVASVLAAGRSIPIHLKDDY